MSSHPPYGVEDASYRAAGGLDGLRRLVDDFYRIMDESPAAAELRRIHPADLSASRDKLTCFLSGWLGGPPLFEQKRGPPRLRMRHAPYTIDGQARDEWLLCMRLALTEQVPDMDFRAALQLAFEQMADHLINVADHGGCTCGNDNGTPPHEGSH